MSNDSGDRPVRGMVLAAGYGKRLRPLSILKAKPAIPFLNRPLIWYSLDLLRGIGVHDIGINIHYARDTVVSSVIEYIAHLKSNQEPRIVFSEEPEILGTAGGIGQLRDFLSGGDIVVSNGKIYFEEDLTAALAYHRRQEAVVTMVLVPSSPEAPFNPVLLASSGEVAGFPLRSSLDDFSNAYIFTGVQILSDRVLEYIPEGPFETVRDLYPRLQANGLRIQGYVSQQFWCESSLPSRYLNNSVAVLARRGQQNLLSEDLPGKLHCVVAGEDVQIGQGCQLENVIIWPGSRVGANCRLRNVIICDGLELRRDTVLQDTVVTPRLETIPGSLAAEGDLQDNCVFWPLR